MPETQDLQAMQSLLVQQNKQLLDANKMLVAFLSAVLLKKHNGAVVLHKDDVIKEFNKYNITWTPVLEGSDHFVMKAVRPGD